ncbi:class I SAM-dependent DNA methyltransferase [Pseudomonas leptonychotis]|uniref:site-specific DNA-methyltransferase (adenine-specific) n=1 Tax=Pseudomonas leptonychotis TaxID=2448482 RepID=A0A4T1ZX52_9PSED|nr:DNA methyltransferase [Pseudomonas leptonychotis]TIH07486.1 class I SAM-dependent DNA methyltransferase [Pseudomonas leptonychotis]
MSINQTQLYDTLESLTQQADVQAEFIYGFLDAYGFAKSTITQIRNGGVRNVAKIGGDVGLKGQLYFHPAQAGESVHEAADRLKASDIIKTQKIRFVIVTDYKELVAYDLKADERMETPLTELHQLYSFFLPLAGLEKSYTHSESVADVKAAEKMGRLFDLIRERNQITTADEVHGLNVFLTRLLFCFFAEDTEIFARHQFSGAIKSTTREDGGDVAEFLGKLFAVLSEPEDGSLRLSMPAHLIAFPYVNGGLFAQQIVIPEFGARARRLLLECGTLDWSQINPDIFGSMFQAVIDEEQRSTMGQHYTSVSNIMKVIKPLFIDKLYAELERSRGSEKKLKDLLERVACIKVFDPACGSGNFLIIAYKELRRFEMEVFRALNEVSKQRVMFMTGIKLSQFYGIEIDDFAHEIALLSLWLVEHQMNTEFKVAFGYAEPLLPLKASGNIVHGNSLRLDWNDVCPITTDDEMYMIGNPPFVASGKDRSQEQGDDMALVFQGFDSYKDLDLVACWFWKGAQYIDGTRSELALVSTNSICQGEQVAMLWPSILNLGLHISFAYQPFKWKNSAKKNAAVHVVIVGLSANPSSRVLFKSIGNEWHAQIISNVSPYLLEGSNTVAYGRRKPIAQVTPFANGSIAADGGHLILDAAEREQLIASEPASAKWIKPYRGADDLLSGITRYCLWLANCSADELNCMPGVMKRVERVKATRLLSPKDQTKKKANTPHLFTEIRQPREGSYLAIPRTSSENRMYVPIGYVDSSVIANNDLQIIPNATLYEFGVLTSIMHNDWIRVVAGRMKSDYRYSASLVYNTFPWPEASEAQRAQIEALAEEVLMVRERYPEKSLADLYDLSCMPDSLTFAHKALDAAVERLYRSRPFRDTSERLDHLFARYEMLIEQERQLLAAQAATKKTRKPRASKTAA